MLLSADQLKTASMSSVTSSHQHVLTMKTALLNQSICAAVLTLASATRTSVVILVNLNVQKDMNKPSSHHMSAAQLPSASTANTQQQPRSTQQPHQHTPLVSTLLVHQKLTCHQLNQPSPSRPSQQQPSVLMMKVLHDVTENNGRSVNANHAAALLQVLLNAPSKLVRPTNAKKVPTKSEHTTLMNVALLQLALLAHQKNAQNVHQPRFQLVSATKMLSADRLIQPAAATNTIVNVTRTSASILPKKLAQLVTHEPLSILVPVVQLLNVVKSQHQPRLQALLPTQQALLQLQRLQSLISHQPLQSLSASMLMVVNDVMVRAGLLKINHAQSTLATLLTTSELLSENAVTSELVARPLNVRLLMSLTNAVLSTHVKPRSAKMSSVQKLFQIANTMKI
jgi:hypothetical protein